MLVISNLIKQYESLIQLGLIELKCYQVMGRSCSKYHDVAIEYAKVLEQLEETNKSMTVLKQLLAKAEEAEMNMIQTSREKG